VPLSLYKVCTTPRREANLSKGINERDNGQGVRNLQMNSPRYEASENAAVPFDVASGLPDCKMDQRNQHQCNRKAAYLGSVFRQVSQTWLENLISRFGAGKTHIYQVPSWQSRHLSQSNTFAAIVSKCLPCRSVHPSGVGLRWLSEWRDDRLVK